MKASKEKIKIGLFGLGTVGQGLLAIIRQSSLPIEITAVVDRSYQKKQEILQDIPASHDPLSILDNEEIDIVVELLGGSELPLYIVREALDRGKHVVTANKFLLAEHGYALFHKSAESKGSLAFEAAVAGGLPIIRNLTDIFANEKIMRLEGILNGTSNYILTVMRKEKKSYAEVLQQAQALGLAEADPTLDINGMDATHKLAILASLISGHWVDYHKIETRGIESIRLPDIQWAEKNKQRIRLLAYLEQKEQQLSLRVEPVLLDAKHFLWDVEMENNAIFFEAQFSGPHVFMGKGAGMYPTAYSVLSDIIALKNQRLVQNSLVAKPLEYANLLPSHHLNRFYLRFCVADRPGVLAAISKVLAHYNISIATVHQDGSSPTQNTLVDLIVITHKILRKDLLAALQEIHLLDFINEQATYLPIYHGG